MAEQRAELVFSCPRKLERDAVDHVLSGLMPGLPEAVGV